MKQKLVTVKKPCCGAVYSSYKTISLDPSAPNAFTIKCLRCHRWWEIRMTVRGGEVTAHISPTTAPERPTIAFVEPVKRAFDPHARTQVCRGKCKVGGRFKNRCDICRYNPERKQVNG